MSYLYLICNPDENSYKIGITRKNVEKRLKSLQTACSAELHVIHTVETDYPFRLETLLHNHFKNKKLSGEWFALTSDDIKNFKETCNKYLNIINIMKINPFFSKNIK